MTRLAARCLPLLAAALLVAGCASFGEQPVGPASAPVVSRHVGTSKPAAKPSRRRGDERPESYVVQRGDTLFGIALDFGFDYRELATWNDIQDPSRILAGQTLRLMPPVKDGAAAKETPVAKDATPAKDAVPDVKPLAAQVQLDADALPAAVEALPDAASPKASATTGGVPVLTEPRATTQPYSDQALARMTRPAVPVVATVRAPSGVDAKTAVAATKPGAGDTKTNAADTRPAPSDPRPAAIEAKSAATDAKPAPSKAAERPDAEKDLHTGDDEALDWAWPVRGDLLYRFGDSGRLKGIGIGGRAGAPVTAAAAGRVVYSGSGLRGYGRLVIVKHNETYLSVYAHNRALAVKEGDIVKRGQKIAEMGDSDATRVGLHFEIRRFGRPVDPLARLPGA